jgi:hypothetical protein
MGCGGSGSNPTSPALAGTYEGTWVNVADATDTGTSTWTIAADGTITGTDTDDSDEGVYTVTGDIDDAGNVDATTRLGEDSDSLTGRLRFDAQNRLTGNLVWDGVPPATYRYTFTRANPN